MPGKVITEEGLQKDLSYVLHGIDCHEILSSVCPPRNGLKVLEPGCGSGKLGIWYVIRGSLVTLLDIDGDALVYASKLGGLVEKALGRKVDFDLVHGSIHKLSKYYSAEFDFVFNEGVPHHWGFGPNDWRRQHSINEMAQVTRPGGSVCVIGSNGICSATLKMAEETRHTYPGMPPRQRPFTPQELFHRLRVAGLVEVNVCPVGETYTGSPLLAGWGRKP